MKLQINILVLAFLLWPLTILASCISSEDLVESTNVVIMGQTAFINKNSSIWQIESKTPYTRSNIFNDLGVNFSGGCSLVENTLDLNFSLYGLAYYPYQGLGKFESDDNRSRVIIDQLKITYSAFDSLQLEGGKLREIPGIFFLRSPANLLGNYSSGFKPTRFYDPLMKSVYQESFWGGRLSRDTRDYTLALTFVPELAHIDKRYQSSGDWSANQRSNASERYLLNYTDYRLGSHTPSFSMKLGDSRSFAISDSFNYTPQWVINAELAYHSEQQWHHFSTGKAAEVMAWEFPTSLYATEHKAGIELALGWQYTSDRFSVFGMEYYFQSEGYTRAEWRQQIDFIKTLNRQMPYAFLEQALDPYKYLIGSEINNTANGRMLQGRHYINIYSSMTADDRSTLQPYLVVNMVDGSSMLGVHYTTPFEVTDDKLEIYTGAYTALGNENSEFALFGKTLGIYFGFKYSL